MEQHDYYRNFTVPIMAGDVDEFLDSIILAVKQRKQDMAPKIWEFRSGDTVRIVNCNPKYLVGALAEVQKVNRTKVVVRLFETASSRFTKFSNITIPLTMIEKV